MFLPNVFSLIVFLFYSLIIQKEICGYFSVHIYPELRKEITLKMIC